jgi:bacterioferritin-associated ferredoxin
MLGVLGVGAACAACGAAINQDLSNKAAACTRATAWHWSLLRAIHRELRERGVRPSACCTMYGGKAKGAHQGASVIMSEPVLKYTPACVPYGALAAALLSGLSLTASEDSTLARDAPATLTLPSGYVPRAKRRRAHAMGRGLGSCCALCPRRRETLLTIRGAQGGV